MFGLNNRFSATGDGKKRRLPVFSISLVACYLVVSAIFFVYGFGEGRAQPAAPAEQPVEVLTVAPQIDMPEVAPEPQVYLDDSIPLPPPVQVRGIWVGAWFSGDPERMENFIDLVDTTELNTIVLDLKEEHGHVTFLTDNEIISGTARDLVPNIEELVADMQSRGIYVIGRIVCFKDPIWSFRNPELSHRDNAGNRWTDRNGVGWLNPYNRDNWEYLVEIGREGARLGFDEIQLDYVRFPVEGRLSDIYFGQAGEEQTRAEIIAEFAGFMRDEMHKLGGRVSADVFAISGISDRDAELLGQEFELLLPNLDAISPMIYPSHFANEGEGAFGNGVGSVINGVLFTRPALEPHGVVYNTLQHFKRRMEPNNPNQAVMRPFIQNSTDAFLGEGFFIPYGAEEVLAQIQAVYDAGFDQWLLWSNVSRYSEDAFRDS